MRTPIVVNRRLAIPLHRQIYDAWRTGHPRWPLRARRSHAVVARTGGGARGCRAPRSPPPTTSSSPRAISTPSTARARSSAATCPTRAVLAAGTRSAAQAAVAPPARVSAFAARLGPDRVAAARDAAHAEPLDRRARRSTSFRSAVWKRLRAPSSAGARPEPVPVRRRTAPATRRCARRSPPI